MKNNRELTDDHNDDLPPELEDLSEELNKIRINKGKFQSDEGEIKVNVINNFDNNKQISEKIQNSNSNTNKEEEFDSFGSFMKKGFFKKQSQTNSTVESNQPKVEDLTHIKSKSETTTKSSLIEDVKKEVTSNSQKQSPETTSQILNNIVNKKDEWMNQDLLSKIAQKPELLKYFMDPRFTEVLALMQKDPQAAYSRYGHVKEFSDFMKEFSSIMADHFNNLSKQKNEQKLQELQNNPSNSNNSSNSNSNAFSQFDEETQEILNDPRITPIIFKLQTEGKLDIEEVNKDIYLSTRIKKLIDKGVFRVQKESELNNQSK